MNSIPLNFTVSDFDIFIGLGRQYEDYKVAEIYDNGSHQVPVVVKLKVKPNEGESINAEKLGGAIYLCFHNSGEPLWYWGDAHGNSGTGLVCSDEKNKILPGFEWRI
ncbi:hypothetical protein, partial [Burkholderia ambifaria]|uniref:hypothetical protein n=1 Tax=Burkholderia ambifaria TaxID=152480 RepID=UPI000B2A9544